MQMSLIVPAKNLQHFKIALSASGGWHTRNPDILRDDKIMVFVQFDEDCRDYHKFCEVYERLITPIIEIDNRKWYTKLLNNIKNWFR